MVGQKRILKLNAIPVLNLHHDDHVEEIALVPSTSTSLLHQSTSISDKGSTFLQPTQSPTASPTKKRKPIVFTDESGSESSPLPSSIVHTQEVVMESSGSDSSASRKRKRIKLEHSYM